MATKIASRLEDAASILREPFQSQARAELKALRAVVRAARPKKRRDNYGEPTACVSCGQTYLLDDGKDPSPECHPCAQDVLADVRRVIARLDLISKRNAGGGR